MLPWCSIGEGDGEGAGDVEMWGDEGRQVRSMGSQGEGGRGSRRVDLDGSLFECERNVNGWKDLNRTALSNGARE